LAGVHTVAIDPHRGYANGVAEHLVHATLVVDPFHAIRLANQAIDDVRRRMQQDTFGHRGGKGDPLYGIRRLLLRANERLSAHARARLEAGLAAGDPSDEVLDAWFGQGGTALDVRRRHHGGGRPTLRHLHPGGQVVL